MPLIVAVLSLVLAAAVLGPARADTIEVRARAVPLDAKNPARHTVGRLRYRGGLELSASDNRFGGFSGLAVGSDGRRLLAVSDHGYVLDARLVYGAGGDLVGVERAHMGPLRGIDGNPLEDKEDRDAESLSPLPDGAMLVTFERRHRLLSYDFETAPRMVGAPPQLALAPANGGIEAATLTADGRLLLLTEDLTTARGRDAGVAGWIGSGAGGAATWELLTYATDGRFNPTGAATLPDGDVVVVERRFTFIEGVTIRLRHIDQRALRGDSLLDGPLLATLRKPLVVDNFEGVDARRGDGGETLIYLISDDNYNIAQRTLLLMFELVR